MQHDPPESARPVPGPADRDQRDVVAFLADPRTHGGAAVQRIDTHAAMVFLAGDRAVKLKRAVHYPYLDFSTADRRRAACEAELALNRRTAPDLYQRVEPVVRRGDGALALGGAGEVLDWVVVMRRFPDEALFDRMAEAGSLTPELMRGLADAIAAFHVVAERRPDGPPLRPVVEENLEELRASPALFPPARVERLAALSTQALARLDPLLEERRRCGLVRHCHGDLHLRNIVLLDGRPTLFDAIEFDPAFAIVDVLYDLAFLLMDLEHRRLRPLGNAVLNRYLEVTGDLAGLAALPLFLSARAAVRAKIAGTVAAMKPGGSAAAAEAVAYLDHAVAALEPPAPRLVAVGGLSGTGKSVLARGLAPSLGPAPGAVVLRSDSVRKALFGVAETERLPAEGYAPGVTERVYAILAERAAQVLAAGHAAVIDAVCARPDERALFESVARRAGVRFDGLWLEAPLELRIDRVSNRRKDASDATAEVAQRQETYDLGQIRWMRMGAGRVAADVLAEARKRLA